MLKRFLLSSALLVGIVGVAAAQLWPNVPIVGGAAYCSATGNNSVCTNTVPIGPTVITGNENIPGDTNLSGGRNPQTVKFSMASLNLLPAAFETITSGSSFYTYTFPNTTGKVVFVASGTVSDERVTAPPAPVDGQIVRVSSTHTITAFQFIANTGQTLAVTTPTVLTASTTVPQGYSWIYRSSDAKWYRLQ